MIAEATSLNTIDFMALGILALSIFVGLARGFTRDAIGTAAIIVALFITFACEPYYGPPIQHYLGKTTLVVIASGIAVFLIISTIFTFIGERLGSSIQKSAIGSLDRTLGLAFGFARGAFVISFLYLIVGIISPKLPENMITARFAPWYLSGAHTLSKWIPTGTFGLKESIPIADFKPEDIYNTIESLDEAVKGISTLKPVSPDKKDDENDQKTGL